MEKATSVADGAKFWGREIVELDNELICRGLGFSAAAVKFLNVLVKTLEAYN